MYGEEFLILEVKVLFNKYEVRLKPLTDEIVIWNEKIKIIKESDLGSNHLFRVDSKTARIM